LQFNPDFNPLSSQMLSKPIPFLTDLSKLRIVLHANFIEKIPKNRKNPGKYITSWLQVCYTQKKLYWRIHMTKIAIMTDSSAYLPQALLDQYHISTVPLTLHWEGKSYYDGVDITAEELYTQLLNATSLPTTSQVTVGQFEQAFGKLLDQGKQVFYMGISSGISSTMDSAYAAVKSFPNKPLEVMDTKLVSIALGFMVLTVARAAEQGASLQECRKVAEESYAKIGVYFTVDTLTYLHKGGRINTAKRLLGSMLNMKPLMEIRDGKIELVESVRSRKKAIERMLELAEKNMGDAKPVRVSPFHALCLEEAKQLQADAEARFHPVENILSEVSPVIGSHTGPGTISLAFMAG
jgi:DegV family protein with EDD domain